MGQKEYKEFHKIFCRITLDYVFLNTVSKHTTVNTQDKYTTETKTLQIHLNSNVVSYM